MIILINLFQFNVPLKEMMIIYFLYIRSVVEQSCVVWASSITEDECLDIERTQKCALRLILKEQYVTYEHALSTLDLPTLRQCTELLQLRFAVRCSENEKTEQMFPLRKTKTNTNTRNPEKFHIPQARTSRLANSAIPTMARLLNKHSTKDRT